LNDIKKGNILVLVHYYSKSSKMQKIFSIVVMIFCLSGCIVENWLDRNVSLRIANPIISNSDSANKYYEQNYNPNKRKYPIENHQYVDVEQERKVLEDKNKSKYNYQTVKKIDAKRSEISAVRKNVNKSNNISGKIHKEMPEDLGKKSDVEVIKSENVKLDYQHVTKENKEKNIVTKESVNKNNWYKDDKKIQIRKNNHHSNNKLENKPNNIIVAKNNFNLVEENLDIKIQDNNEFIEIKDEEGHIKDIKSYKKKIEVPGDINFTETIKNNAEIKLSAKYNFNKRGSSSILSRSEIKDVPDKPKKIIEADKTREKAESKKKELRQHIKTLEYILD
jgi:hypothetical protein